MAKRNPLFFYIVLVVIYRIDLQGVPQRSHLSTEEPDAKVKKK